MVVFAGETLNDVWALSFADTSWSLIRPRGTPPSARSGHSAVYDPWGDRMIVFGGSNSNELWELTFSDTTWT
jgi:hypothetical protein